MKIDLDWIQEELDAGREVRLECVDKDGFINRKYGLYSENNTGILESELIVLEAHNGFIRIKDTSSNIVYSEFKYFRIKQYPTFDDLIDAAVQAKKDGVCDSVEIDINNWLIVKSSAGNIHCHKNHLIHDNEFHINWIKSLYTETFVIEGSICILKINENIQALVLANGCDIVDRVYFEGGSMRLRDCFGNSISLTNLNILKGATVTQQKGNK